jgi:hypothetical protein
LGFHDAAGGGGPNGCIDFNTGDNNGLQDVVASLDSIYTTNNLGSIISKADFWVLAGNTAIQYATTTPANQKPDSRLPAQLDPSPYTLILPFRYGRVDATTCDDEGYLPSADFSWSETYALFGGRFGMNIKETVAILGGHSVGRCQWANSGFDGGWTSSQSSFSNVFYQSYAGIPWINGNKSSVWVDGPPQNILLTCDVELLFKTSTKGTATCNDFDTMTASANCPLQGQSSSAFIAYANSNAQFFGNFSTAWQKMTEYTYTSKLANVGSTPIDSAYPSTGGTVTTSSPTLAPTTAAKTPTASPSRTPTLAPTVRSPTAAPTVKTATSTPTRVPTRAPTQKTPTAPTRPTPPTRPTRSATAGIIDSEVEVEKVHRAPGSGDDGKTVSASSSTETVHRGPPNGETGSGGGNGKTSVDIGLGFLGLAALMLGSGAFYYNLAHEGGEYQQVRTSDPTALPQAPAVEMATMSSTTATVHPGETTAPAHVESAVVDPSFVEQGGNGHIQAPLTASEV